jgi:hypothetical protein
MREKSKEQRKQNTRQTVKDGRMEEGRQDKVKQQKKKRKE